MADRWQPSSPPVSTAELATVLSSHAIVVIHFWAAWNGVDRLFAAKLATIQQEYEERIVFRSADVDVPELWSFCRECGVVNVPALAYFVRGKRVKTVVGARTEEELRAHLRGLLAQTESTESGTATSQRKWWQVWR